MSNKLPVPLRKDQQGYPLVVPGQPNAASSAIARMAISLAPDILRAAERALLQRDSRPAQPQKQSQGIHGHSVSMSEIEIDTSIPFVRRVTVRNASSWSTAPMAQPLPAGTDKRGRGRLIGASSAIIVLVALMARKVMPGGKIIDIQGKQRD